MIKVDNDWQSFLDEEQSKDYYRDLKSFLA